MQMWSEYMIGINILLSFDIFAIFHQCLVSEQIMSHVHSEVKHQQILG